MVLPIENGDFPISFFVCLPEGTHRDQLKSENHEKLLGLGGPILSIQGYLWQSMMVSLATMMI